MPQNLDPSIESLLRPFLEQSAPIRSIVTLGSESGVLPASRAQQPRALSPDASGDDLLVVPAQQLHELITPLAKQFSFRAAVRSLAATARFIERRV